MGSNVTTITGEENRKMGKENRKMGAENRKMGAEKRTNGCGEENRWVRRREIRGAEKRINGCREENKWVRRREIVLWGHCRNYVQFILNGSEGYAFILCIRGHLCIIKSLLVIRHINY